VLYVNPGFGLDGLLGGELSAHLPSCRLHIVEQDAASIARGAPKGSLACVAEKLSKTGRILERDDVSPCSTAPAAHSLLGSSSRRGPSVWRTPQLTRDSLSADQPTGVDPRDR